MQYVAIMNTPGYMPWADDEPPVFDAAADAWAYLAEERRAQEECDDSAEEYSETAGLLASWAAAGHGPDVLYGDTPGRGGAHDLGIAYTVLTADS